MDLDKKLAELVDRDEIRRCIFTAARGMDRHDDDLLESAFHEDAIDDHGGVIGPAWDFFKKTLTRDHLWRGHQHCIMNQSIDFDGDTAHCESYFLVLFLRKEDDQSDVSVGRYLDRLEKRDDVWRIAYRLTILDWTASLPPKVVDSVLPETDQFVSASWDRSDPSYWRPLTSHRPARDLWHDER